MSSSEVLFNLLETQKAVGIDIGFCIGVSLMVFVFGYLLFLAYLHKSATNERRDFLNSVDDKAKLKYYQIKHGDDKK